MPDSVKTPLPKDSTALKNNILLVVIIFFIIVIIKSLLSLNFPTPWIMGDENVYDVIANRILEGNFLDMLINKGQYPPAYPLCISCSYLLSQDKNVVYHLMLVINTIVSTSGIFPAYFILRKYLQPRMSVLGSLVVVTLPPMTVYNFVLMGENLFFPLFIFSIWFIIEYIESNRRMWLPLITLSIVGIYLTRTVGISMIVGIVVALLVYRANIINKENYKKMVTERVLLVLSIVIPYIIIIIAQSGKIVSTVQNFVSGQSSENEVNMSISGYEDSRYIETLSAIFSSTGEFGRFLILLLHEIEYLIIASYIIFIFVCIVSYVYKSTDKRGKNEPLSAAFGYFAISSAIILFITIIHMYTYGGPYDNPHYTIFGRYLDQTVIGLTLFGLIGLGTLSDKVHINKKMLSISAITVFCVSAILIASFPHETYQIASTMSIYYIQYLKDVTDIHIFFVLFTATAFAVLLISIYKKNIAYVMLFIILLSIVFTYFAYNKEMEYSRDTDKYNQIAYYLKAHATQDTLILVDGEDYSTVSGQLLLANTQFWTSGDLIRYQDETDRSGVYVYNQLVTRNASYVSTCYPAYYPKIQEILSKNADYAITSKILPYQMVCATVTGFKLYKYNQTEEDQIDLPYRIQIGIPEGERISNFYDTSENMRWTKNSSYVYLRYPSGQGPMNLTISAHGESRPETEPASISLYINGNLVNCTVLNRSQRTYSCTVPLDALNPCYQVLEIRTNTWRPREYGSADTRDLGIQIDWIAVNRSDPNS